MIDLHTHTTASDGRLTPADLVASAAAAGLTVVSVTDHDTVAGLEQARAAASAAGIMLISGIEITAVEQGMDVHVLGYFFDSRNRALLEFLESQRDDRVRRVREIARRLGALGCPIDTGGLEAQGARAGSSVGRPHVADALVAAGHAADRADAFERLIGRGRPAFVPRRGAPAAEVIGVIRSAGGLASLAHPGLTCRDDLIPTLVSSGLGALEARHSDHDPATETRYRQLAARCGLAITGGSDFHGGGHHAPRLGMVTLPTEDFVFLQQRAG